MPVAHEAPWIDDAAGRLVRPYTVSNGRTRPTNHFDLLTLVTPTGRSPRAHLGPDHTEALGLCGGPTPVAEVAARLGLPAVVTKILLSDLVDSGVLTAHAPAASTDPADDLTLLEAVLRGLRRRL